MAGQMTVLDVEFTDTTLPKIHNDFILSNGSLYLFDMAHSLGRLSSVPVGGSVIPNVAATEAAAILGVAANTLNGSFVSQAQAADARFELSGKGGIHGIYSQVNNVAAGRGAYVGLPTAIINYLIANKTHQFYLSAWVRRTRAALAAPLNGVGMPWLDLGAGANYLARAGGSRAGFKISANSKVLPAGGLNSVANRYVVMSGSAGSGDTITTPRGAMLWGGILTGDSFTNVAPSDILYRTYMEDLTVSGRNYAEVEAIDKALWDVAFAVGGRYYGDTFTAPSAFP